MIYLEETEALKKKKKVDKLMLYFVEIVLQGHHSGQQFYLSTHPSTDIDPVHRLQHRDALDLDIRVQRQCLDRNASIETSAFSTCIEHTTVKHIRDSIQRGNVRPAWLDIPPVLHVDRVHLGKVVHVGQEDVDLDDLVDARAGGLEDVGQVLDALVLDSRISLISATSRYVPIGMCSVSNWEVVPYEP